jgi:hypothetical protein
MKKNGLAGNSGRGRKPGSGSPKSTKSAKGAGVAKLKKTEEFDELLSLQEEEGGAGDNFETPSKKTKVEVKEEAGLI